MVAICRVWIFLAISGCLAVVAEARSRPPHVLALNVVTEARPRMPITDDCNSNEDEESSVDFTLEHSVKWIL